MGYFNFKHLRGDFLGGITAGIVALPLALAFGVSSGLGPGAGLFGAIFIGFFAALFGGTETQISGPTAPMTAVSMIVIAGIIASNEGNISKALPLILLVFLLGGLFQILLGILGVGKYIRYIPYPVVSGFMTAIGVIILITQLLPVLGYNVKNDKEYIKSFEPLAEERLLEKILDKEVEEGIMVLEHLEIAAEEGKKITAAQIQAEALSLAKNSSSGVIGSIKRLPAAIRNINWLEAILAFLTILIIYGFKYVTKKVPSTLVALIVVSAGAYFLKLDYTPIDKIPEGLPIPHFEMFGLFDFARLSPYIFAALTLAFLGAIDSLLTSIVADNMTKTKHNPNRELIGQGIGNSIAALFGGIPGAGATIRTVVNIHSGGKTRISGLIAGVLLFIILIAMGPVASQIPSAVLAGILVTVGIGVMDYKGLKAIPKMPRDAKIHFLGFKMKFSTDVLIMLTVLILSSFWNLINAVGIGLLLASLIFMRKIGQVTSAQSDVVPLQDVATHMKLPREDEKDFPQQLRQEVYIKRLKGPLFFGFTSEFQKLSKEIPKEAVHVIIRMDEVPYMDQSGLYAMEDVLMDLLQRNVGISFVGLKEQPRAMMSRIDIIPDLIPESKIFTDFPEAIEYIKNNIEDRF